MIQECFCFYHFDDRRDNDILQTFYFQKFSLLFSRNETRPNPLSELWQIAVQSALNLEINHCFPLRARFPQISHFPQHHVQSTLYFRRERRLRPLLPCFDSRFNWAVVGQPASVTGETAMSQEWLREASPMKINPHPEAMMKMVAGNFPRDF